MRIQTSNKLALLQCEYQNLYNQTCMLQNQEQPLLSQLNVAQNYVLQNPSDRLAQTRFKNLRLQYRSLASQINRNAIRLNKLQMSINREQTRLSVGRQPRRNCY